MSSKSASPSAEVAAAKLRTIGYLPSPLIRDRGLERWWGLACTSAGRWCLVSIPDALPATGLPTYDPTTYSHPQVRSKQWPPLADFHDATDLILAIIRRRRTTTIEAQWDRRAAIAHLDNLSSEQRDAVVEHLEAHEPDGWSTLVELRQYDANRRVKGRQAEAVQLLKETAQQMWPNTMTPGRLTQFGKRSGDEVFMVLPYESWRDQSRSALRRAVEDAHTTTGDMMRALVTARPFDLSLLS